MELVLAVLTALPIIVSIIDRIMTAREEARTRRSLHYVGKALAEEDVDEVALFLEELGI